MLSQFYSEWCGLQAVGYNCRLTFLVLVLALKAEK